MYWYILEQFYSTLIELLRVSRLSTDDKDLEILVLRQQLVVMVRKNDKVIKPSHDEKWSLAVLTAALKTRRRMATSQLGSVMRIFKPETVICWHRELVRREWKQKPVDGGGRPPISQRVLAYSLRPPRSGSDWVRKDPSVFRVIRNNR